MDWYERLYIGKTVQRKASDYIRKIDAGGSPFQIYLLALAFSPAVRLELMPASELRHWYARRRRPLIVGIARGREEALELLQQIVQDVLKETGEPDFQKYFVSDGTEASGGGDA